MKTNIAIRLDQAVKVFGGKATSALTRLNGQAGAGAPVPGRAAARMAVVRHQHGTTVLLATHDMAEAEALCDRLAILDHGRLVALDTAAGLKQAAARPTLEEAFLALTGGDLISEEEA